MPPCPALPRIDLDRLIHLIAHTVDLVGEDDCYHGRSVGLIAVQIAKTLGYCPNALRHINYAGLLHDCGVSSTRMHRKLLNAIEWEGAQQHCATGHQLLKDFEPLACFAPIVLYHHTRWRDLQDCDQPKETILLANLIYLADRIDVLCAPFYDDSILLGQTRSIRDILYHYRSDIFAPSLIDAFMEISIADAFWTPLMSPEMVQTNQNALRCRQESPPTGMAGNQENRWTIGPDRRCKITLHPSPLTRGCQPFQLLGQQDGFFRTTL